MNISNIKDNIRRIDINEEERLSDKLNFAQEADDTATSWVQDYGISHVLVEVGGKVLGVESKYICELIKYTKPFHLCSKHPLVMGLSLYRGEYIPILSLEGLHPNEIAEDRCEGIVVLEVEGVKMGMIVDRVVDFAGLPETQTVDEWQESSFEASAFFKGVTSYEGKKVLSLNPDALLSCSNKALYSRDELDEVDE